jgi:hypothetical protein
MEAIKNITTRPALREARFELASSARNHFVITTEAGTTLEQVQSPGYLANVISQLKPYCIVEVRCDDGSYFALFVVLSVTKAEVKMARFVFVDLEVPTAAVQDDGLDLEAKFRGPFAKWSVVRKSDSMVLTEKLESKQ